ncbi:MAG: hypothetical protein LiPW30_736 [Parcubacteria group bacterium LiPW_30]|nr:MAG: hypothetical protein LiPW30_736 [Parcubacteria group bacterium LiPW_30]
MKKIIKNILIFCLVAFYLFGTGLHNSLFAYVMQSGNYRIESDNSLTPTGGAQSSANYIFKDTMGELSTGLSDSASYKLKAGYQEMQEAFLTVSAPADASMTPSIPGITGGAANATILWNVIADGPAGFAMVINASTDIAMKLDASYYFDDYSPALAGTPDYSWGVDAGVAEFGFTVESATTADTVANFKDNGSACNTGALNTADKCWLDFNGATNINVINRSSRTGVDGENENIKFQAQSAAKFLKEGSYVATITTTVSSN